MKPTSVESESLRLSFCNTTVITYHIINIELHFGVMIEVVDIKRVMTCPICHSNEDKILFFLNCIPSMKQSSYNHAISSVNNAGSENPTAFNDNILEVVCQETLVMHPRAVD